MQITLLKTTLVKIAEDAAGRKTPPATRVSEIVEDHYEGDGEMEASNG